MLQLDRKGYESMLAHAKEGLPNEACGLLGGIIHQELKVVKEVYLLRNVDESREHFSMDPKEQLLALKDMRSKGYVLLGNFHSHPETPSRPSEEDKRLAFDPAISYLILSLQEPLHPVLKAFRIVKDTVSEEEIEFVDETEESAETLVL